MEDDSYRHEKFSFRVIDAPNDLIDLVCEKLEASMVKVGSYYKDSSIKILIVKVIEDFDYSDLISIVKSSGVDRKKCGIFASLVTNRDTSGIAVPDFVVDLFFEIGYTLDFSFTVV
jgi:hypothetical protein